MSNNKKHKQNPLNTLATTHRADKHKPSPSRGDRSGVRLLTNFRIQALILAIIAFVFYYNTFSNEFALDDVMVIQQNEYVHKGFKGIPDIVSKDTYAGYYKQMNSANLFSGGRYRPLSVVTFAIEEEILGTDKDENPTLGQTPTENALRYMHVRHVVNVVLYILAVIALLYFLRYVIFRNEPLIAFLAALLFTIHPLHTEVVANIKSRDEILSLLFICLTFISAYKYRGNNKLLTLVVAMLCYFLALLSKEYALTLVMLIPLLFYLFKGYSIKNSLKTMLPYAAVLVIYMIIRFSVITHKIDTADTELQNNPYLLATGIQSIATKIATLLNYLKLLCFPYPLSSDYSYNQIPYVNLSSAKFWLSLFVYASLIFAGINLLFKRHVLCFAIAFYLLNLSLVANLLFNMGATMGERLIFHSSVGFVIALAWLLVKAAEKIKPQAGAKQGLTVVIILVIVSCGYITIARNADWKNTNTLFIKDAQTVPNSFLANGIAGTGYCAMSDMPENKSEEIELLHKGVACLNKAIAIYPKYVQGYYNRALAYDKLKEWAKAKSDLDSVKKYYVTFPNLNEQYQYLYHDMGMAYWKAKKYDEAIAAYNEGCKAFPKDAEMWYMLGISYYSIKDYPKAMEAWDVTLRLNPNHRGALSAYPAAKRYMENEKSIKVMR